MRGLFSGSAILAAAVAVGVIAPSQAMAIDSQGSIFLPPAAVEDGLQIAQTETPQQPAAAEGAAAAAEDENPVDERATDALVDMGETLRNLHTFAVRMDATLEQVMDNGQKIEFGGTALYRVSRPDRLRLDILTDTGWNGNGAWGVAAGVATGVAVGAAIGSTYYALPSDGCYERYVGGVIYYECGSVWYQPSYAGSDVTYVVVDAP